MPGVPGEWPIAGVPGISTPGVSGCTRRPTDSRIAINRRRNRPGRDWLLTHRLFFRLPNRARCFIMLKSEGILQNHFHRSANIK